MPSVHGMGRKNDPVNPFYWVLVASGAMLVVTILALLVSLLTLDPFVGEAQIGVPPLAWFLNRWGGTLVGVETGVLMVAAVLAIALDGFRSRGRQRG